MLQGKYGAEGDQLLYKMLNSGDFLSKVPEDAISNGSKAFTPLVAEKGLRYMYCFCYVDRLVSVICISRSVYLDS